MRNHRSRGRMTKKATERLIFLPPQLATLQTTRKSL
jgi:hypothetical protein